MLAACNGVPLDVFFPGRGQNVNKAKEICGSCRVQEDCRKFAEEHDTEYGVWGGVYYHSP